jgi:hypothetical protein
MKYFILLFLTIYFISGCDIFEDEYIVKLSPVGTIDIANKSTNSIIFIAHASWPNGCGMVDHSEVVKNGTTYFIKVFGTQKKDAICTQALITIDALVNIKYIPIGTYSFSFWQSDTTFVDTTLIFNGF